MNACYYLDTCSTMGSLVLLHTDMPISSSFRTINISVKNSVWMLWAGLSGLTFTDLLQYSFFPVPILRFSLTLPMALTVRSLYITYVLTFMQVFRELPCTVTDKFPIFPLVVSSDVLEKFSRVNWKKLKITWFIWKPFLIFQGFS